MTASSVQHNKEPQNYAMHTYWSELFDHSFDLIHIYDHEERILYINSSSCGKLGITSPLSVQKTQVQPLILKEYQESFHENFKIAYYTGTCPPFKCAFTSKDGDRIFVNAQLSTLHNHTLRSKVLIKGVFRDITREINILRAQELYYNIVEYNIEHRSLINLYKKISSELYRLLYIQNFAALHYKRDKLLRDFVFLSAKNCLTFAEKEQRIFCTVLAQEVIERKTSILIYGDRIKKILEKHNHSSIKKIPSVWGGVLVPGNGGHTQTVLCFYSHKGEASHDHNDLSLLDFIARQISIAIERNSKKEQLADRDARILSIVESSAQQVWSVDKAYKLTFFNKNFSQALKKYFGTGPLAQEGVDALSLQIVSTDERAPALWKKQYDKAFAGKNVQFQIKNHTKNQQEVWREVFLNPIRLPSGTITQVSAVANDITSKHVDAQKIQQSEEKFRTIFESFQDIFLRFTLDGNIFMVSPSVEELTGYATSELLGSNAFKFFFLQKQKTAFLHELKRVQRIQNKEVLIRNDSGKSLTFLCNFRLYNTSLATSAKEKSFIEAVARNITDRKKNNEALLKAKETAERSLRVKQDFLANMSHEIRTPVNGILGTLHLLKDTPLNQEQKECLQIAQKSIEILQDILNDILQLSKIEAGKFTLNLTSVSIRETFQKITHLFKPHVKEAHSILIHIDKHVPEHLVLDETRLLQILSNLTSNAIKFSKDSVSVDIEAKMLTKNKQSLLYVAIKDTGIGIKEEDSGRLFKSFSQLDGDMKKKFRGTGLGLSISKSLAESMGGEIGVHSTHGMGSTFWFTFKVETGSALKTVDTPHRVSSQKNFYNFTPKVLLVEDNRMNAKIFNKLLLRAGCEVVAVDNGQEAIRIAQHEPLDVILMDIQMPQKDGVKTTEEMRALISDLPPVIAMTAYSMEEDKSRFLLKGLDDYLSKPIQPTLLVEKVREWSKGHREQCMSATCLDVEVLKTLCTYSEKSIIHESIHMFIDETANVLQKSFSVLEKQEYPALAEYMHSLKGAASTLGAHPITDLSKSIEKQIHIKNYTSLFSQFECLLLAFNVFKRSYKKILKQIEL